MRGMAVHYVLAFVLFLVGLSLLGCGANVCWMRWSGRARGKSVDELRQEDAEVRRRREASTPTRADKR
jgi:hypothetical protein